MNKQIVIIALMLLCVKVDAQKNKVPEKPFYLIGNSDVYYTDSSVINGQTVYTDSLVWEKKVIYTDSIVDENALVIYTDSNICKELKNYHIQLHNDPLFTAAIYKNSYDYHNLMQLTIIKLLQEQSNKVPVEKGMYFVFSSDKKYVKYASVRYSDTDKYKNYLPITENKNSSYTFSMSNMKHACNWVATEMEKGNIVSIGRKNKHQYICKSFENSLK